MHKIKVICLLHKFKFFMICGCIYIDTCQHDRLHEVIFELNLWLPNNKVYITL